MFFTIKNDKELREDYLLLKHFGDDCREWSDIMKKSIRYYIANKKEKHIVRDYGDGDYIELIDLPEEIQTNEEADKYFLNYEFRQVDSPWDCSGQSFTAWYKIFKRHNHYIAYHSVGIAC